jgi:hypothetical protein
MLIDAGVLQNIPPLVPVMKPHQDIILPPWFIAIYFGVEAIIYGQEVILLCVMNARITIVC